MEKLSVVIITYNEENNIGRCIDSVQAIADEVVVVDSFSTDKTEKICRSYGVRFYQRMWDNYSEQKNYANSLASFDYVLSIDADEVLSEELLASIKREKENFIFDAYKFNRLTFFCGYPIRHCGWYPDAKVRLWNKTLATWNGSVHEGLVFNNTPSVKCLAGDLLHYTTSSIHAQVEKVNHYTENKAKEAFVRGKRVSAFKILLKPGYKFFSVYVLKLGFLDGFAGLLISLLSALDSFLFLSKLKLMNKEHNEQ